jgi:hypothetical protein
MQIYFDESGDFRPVSAGVEKLCFVVSVIIPENSTATLKTDFDFFIQQLTDEEFVKREPKGFALSLGHRKLLLEILKAHRNVSIVPVSVNLGCSGGPFFTAAPSRIRSLIQSNLGIDSAYMSKDERAELARRFGRLSAQGLTRLYSYGIATLKAVEAVASRYYCEEFHSCYNPIKLTFDRFGKAGCREELILKDSMFGWITAWSRRIPMKRDISVDESHPLFTLYGDTTPNQLAFDLRKMLKGKIAFSDSKKVWQIQLADFLAHTWSRTIADYRGNSGYRVLFRDLYSKSALPDSTPIGLVALTDETKAVEGPLNLEIFARMVSGDAKILPCQ